MFEYNDEGVIAQKWDSNTLPKYILLYFFFLTKCLAWNNHFVCSHSHFPLLIKGLSTRLVAHIGQVPTTAQPKRDARPDLHFITPPAPENHLLDSQFALL